MAIPEEIIRQVRESTDIVEIVSEHVALTKRGRANYFGLCPFHDDRNPSFSVHTERQTYHCFSCGEGGNVFTFLMKIEGIEFPEAVRVLAERAGIRIDEDAPGAAEQRSEKEAIYQANDIAMKFYRYRLMSLDTPDVHFAREYLGNRGLGEDLQEKFKIGLAPEGWDELLKVAGRRGLSAGILEKAGLARLGNRGNFYDWFRGRLMFPIFNTSGRVVAFGGRILKDDPERPQPKYINTSDTPVYNKGRLLYGITQARDTMRAENKAIVVEGYTDLISLHSAGFNNAVAGLGTALTPEQGQLIKRFSNDAILLYDSDVAGDKAAYRGADVLLGTGINVTVALMPEGEDPDTLIRNGGHEAMANILSSAKPLIDFKLNYFRRQGLLDTPQGRGDATHAILDTVMQVKDPITRQYVLHEAAEKLGVDERTLLTELNARRPRAQQHKGNTPAPQAPQRTSYYEEMLYNLLWVLLNVPERRSEVFSYFSASDLGNHPLRPAFQWLEVAHIEGEDVQEADLYNSLSGNQDLVRLLGSVLTKREQVNEKHINTIVTEAPRILRIRAAREELQTVKNAMKQGSGVETMRRFQELNAELKELESGIKGN